MGDQNMKLVLSTDAKPRLKWTPDLHQRFIIAVNDLGGPEKATPKNLMRIMGIQGLTLFHLKSHLQKYRLGKNQGAEICKDFKEENVDCEESCSLNEVQHGSIDDQIIQENAHIGHAIQLQMDVQRKIHEQIEVQKHLQLRIEAQGKYLRKVLKIAHEALSNYNNSSSSIGVHNAKTKLSQLALMVSNSSSFSEITDEATNLSIDGIQNDSNRAMWPTGCSVESSLTSSESSEIIKTEERDTVKYNSKKRSKSEMWKSILVQEISSKKSKEDSKDEIGNGLTNFDFLETFDLNNSECENDLKLGIKEPIIDLNLKM